MTLDEAIKHEYEVAEENSKCAKRIRDKMKSEVALSNVTEYETCADEHRQLALWLKELKQLRERQSCEDAISRQAVIDMISNAQILSDESGEYCGYCTEDIDIESIPSVNPTKTGHWIAHSDGGIWIKYYECSECGKVHDTHSDYCPNCGAMMIEPQAEKG